MTPDQIVIPRRELPPRPPARRGLPWWAWTLLAITALLATPPAIVLALRWLPPPTTAFMLQSEVRPVSYRWVPATQIADAARKAAVAAEDQKFYTHFGFDFEAIGKALEHNEKSRRKRGASTITQQVAKNLFLWPGRSWFRKGVEVSFTVLLELMWPKERILEVYLNIAEFGPGVYGVEAAAQKFFGKPAARLAPEEAARLAAVLPNPRRWRADRPGPYVQSRAQAILRLMGYGPPPTPADQELMNPAGPAEAPPDPDAATEPGAQSSFEESPGEAAPDPDIPQSEPAAPDPAPGEEEAMPPEPGPAAEPPLEEPLPERAALRPHSA